MWWSMFVEWINCWRGEHDFKFIRNLYGDEINSWEARSVWRCGVCGKMQGRPHLFKRKRQNDRDTEALEDA